MTYEFSFTWDISWKNGHFIIRNSVPKVWVERHSYLKKDLRTFYILFLAIAIAPNMAERLPKPGWTMYSFIDPVMTGEAM